MDRFHRTGEWTGALSRRWLKAATSGNRSWKAIVLTAACVGLLAIASGCGGGSSKSSSGSTTTDPVTISVTPQTVTVPVSTSQQFSATVSNSSNTSVTWQVNGTTGGSTTYGVISTSGLYTAPATVPSGTVTVTAVAQADTSKTASATVTVSSANTLTVTPTQTTVPAGGQQTFSAKLGDQSVAATWAINCTASAFGCGKITQDGIYTAPLSPPPGRTVTITASANNANSASVGVVISFGSGALLGPYSFALKGTEGTLPYRAVGSITFDGKGGITGGTEDRPGRTVNITGGTYTADSQGRVTATLNTDAGDESWQITLVDHSRALVMRTDPAVIAHGDMDLQGSLQFGKALNGQFTFQLAGSSAGAAKASGMVGSLSFDQGTILSGALDSNDGGTVLSNAAASGSSTPPAANSSNGRGTLTVSSSFGTQTFAYYVVSATSAKLIETDGAHDLAGQLVSRTPAIVDATSFQGNYAFVFSGANPSEAVAQGGTFTIARNGDVSNGTLDRSTDTVGTPGFVFSGSLVVKDPVTGRSVVTFNSGAMMLQYVVYPPSLNYSDNYELPFLEIDGNAVTTGLALQQVGTSSSGSTSLSGQFALLAGEASSAVHRTITGPVAITSTPTGTLDINDNGVVAAIQALTRGSSFSMASSSYGQGLLQLQTGTYDGKYTTYSAGNGKVLLMEIDGKGALTGVMQSQY